VVHAERTLGVDGSATLFFSFAIVGTVSHLFCAYLKL